MNQDTTPTSGAAIQRYKIGYHADEWGQRSSTPSGIPDASGSWVRYADHVTALAAGQATAAQAVAEPADTVVLNAAMRAIQQAIELIGAPTDERMRAVRRVLRGAVIVAEDDGKVAPLPGTAYAALPTHSHAGRVYEEGFLIGTCPLYTADKMRAFADATYMLRAPHGQAPATQQAGEVRRAELVPGVMHCAKCKFQLNRVTLCVSDGNAYAGNNKTEPCPNGCGPLWPVTWEQEAKNCWKALEEMHERLMAAAAPQPSPTAQAANSVQEDAARLEIESLKARLHAAKQINAAPGPADGESNG